MVFEESHKLDCRSVLQSGEYFFYLIFTYLLEKLEGKIA